MLQRFRSSCFQEEELQEEGATQRLELSSVGASSQLVEDQLREEAVHGVCLVAGFEEEEGVSVLAKLNTVVGGLEAAEAAVVFWVPPFPSGLPIGVPFCVEFLPLDESLLPITLLEETCGSRKKLVKCDRKMRSSPGKSK